MELIYVTNNIQPLVSGESCSKLSPISVDAHGMPVTFEIVGGNLPNSISLLMNGHFSGTYISTTYQEFNITVKASAPMVPSLEKQFKFIIVPVVFNQWFLWAGFYSDLHNVQEIERYFNNNLQIFEPSIWYNWVGTLIDYDIPINIVNIPGYNSWFDSNILHNDYNCGSTSKYFLYYNIDDVQHNLWWLYNTNNDTDLFYLTDESQENLTKIYSDISSIWWNLGAD